MQKLISYEMASSILDYNQETGLFSWKVGRSRTSKGSTAGTLNSYGYIKIKFDGTVYAAHRLAWLLSYGHWPDGEIDHINCVRHDNKISNLRIVDRSGNAQNIRRAKANSKSGFLGASFCKKTNRWYARIISNKKNYGLGSYATAQEAHEAYMKAKSKLHISQP